RGRPEVDTGRQVGDGVAVLESFEQGPVDEADVGHRRRQIDQGHIGSINEQVSRLLAGWQRTLRQRRRGGFGRQVAALAVGAHRGLLFRRASGSLATLVGGKRAACPTRSGEGKKKPQFLRSQSRFASSSACPTASGCIGQKGDRLSSS